jgi:hypothetical protein
MCFVFVSDKLVSNHKTGLKWMVMTETHT